MTHYIYEARPLKTLLLNCNKIAACALLLKTLLSERPISINFHMERSGGHLSFYRYHYASFFDHLTYGKVAFQPVDYTTLEKFILHGSGYTDGCKFELSAEQKNMVDQLIVIAEDYEN